MGASSSSNASKTKRVNLNPTIWISSRNDWSSYLICIIYQWDCIVIKSPSGDKILSCKYTQVENADIWAYIDINVVKFMEKYGKLYVSTNFKINKNEFTSLPDLEERVMKLLTFQRQCHKLKGPQKYSLRQEK